MDVFTGSAIQSDKAKQFLRGCWEEKSPLKIKDGLILANFDDAQHDAILNLKDGLDPEGLRGFMINLVIDGCLDVRRKVNLTAMPARDMILRDMDELFLVRAVQQSTTFGIAAYVKRITTQELEVLTA